MNKNFLILLVLIAFVFSSNSQEIDSTEYYQLFNEYQKETRVLTVDPLDTLLVMGRKLIRPYQLWKFIPASEGYYITNAAIGTDYSLDVRDDFYKMNLTKITGSKSQMWHLVPEREGTFRIQNVQLGKEFSLDCDSYKNGPLVFMAEYPNIASGQYWKLIPTTLTDYTIISVRILNTGSMDADDIEKISNNIKEDLSNAKSVSLTRKALAEIEIPNSLKVVIEYIKNEKIKLKSFNFKETINPSKF